MFELDTLKTTAIKEEIVYSQMNFDPYDVKYTKYTRAGISFRYTITGRINEFSYSEVISAISQLIVFLGFCTTFTAYIGYYLLPHDSQIYRKYINIINSFGYQYINIDKEIAGYALQTAIYSKLFDYFDNDESGIVSYSELKNAISNAMRSKFDDKQIEYLTGLIIEHGINYINISNIRRFKCCRN